MHPYVKSKRVWLKSHPDYSETWIQNLIAEDPSILGLGDLELRDRERRQPRAGRLDLLLQDPDTKRRYEVELQLGATDESHIIRTIEYWDIERKRYPHYDHCAVLVAEDITSRFLNVISLFNGIIPLIGVQMRAVEVEKHITLVFSKIVDELTLGAVEEDEDDEAAPTDKAFWESKASPEIVKLADQLFELVKEVDDTLELKYKKFYIGLSRFKKPFNFVTFRPKKKQISLEIKLPRTDDIDTEIDQAGISTLEHRWGLYRLRLTKMDIEENSDMLRKLMREAYQRRNG